MLASVGFQYGLDTHVTTVTNDGSAIDHLQKTIEQIKVQLGKLRIILLLTLTLIDLRPRAVRRIPHAKQLSQYKLTTTMRRYLS